MTKAKKPPLYTLEKDAKVTGLYVRTTTAGGVRSYVFDGRVNGESRRVTIGRVQNWKLKAARIEARRLATDYDQGVDPRIEKAAKAAQAAAGRLEEQRQGLVLEAVWRDYIEDRKEFWGDRHHKMHELLAAPGGKKRTRGKGLTKPAPLAALMPLKLSDLTAERIAEWLRIEVRKRPTNAAQSFRLLRAFTVWAHEFKDGEAHPYRGVIPADACTAKAVRERVPSPKTKHGDCLEKQQLPAWFKGVRTIGNPTIAAYLQVLLLTGARRTELATLKRADADFTWNRMTIRDKVEGTRVIPLTPYVAQLLSALPRKGKWMFPADSKSGHITEPRIAHDKALELAGLPHVSLHGLRRSFRTLSEWLEIPVGVIAQIQGHKPSATAEKNYTRRPTDMLHMHHARLEAWILEQGGVAWAPLPAGQRLGLVNTDGSVREVAATA
ncbi:MAG: tyrosine-type recombinase/integrase [Steroidobacteraceae bacterium]